MGRDRPREITEEHLAGIFAVYVRQSKDTQVEKNDGGTADQLSLVNFAEELGWPREGIRTFDRDQGHSGMATAHRPDFLEIEGGVEKGIITAIGVRDFMRPARDAADEIALWKKCRIHGVVVVVGRQVYDPRRDDHLFFLQLNALLGEQDGFKRTACLDGGRRAKANKGKHVSRPPAGLVRVADANWDLHPDPLVRANMRRVIDTFFEKGTLGKTRDALVAAGVMIPRTPAGRPVKWVEPTIWNIERILKNPAYAERYHYRKTVSDPKLGVDKKGHWRQRPARPGETIPHEHAHPGYMTPAEQDQILEKLKRNKKSWRHRISKEGSDCFLQGRLYCAEHPARVLSPRSRPPRRDGTHFYQYQCQGLFLLTGKKYCGTVPAAPIHRAVQKAMAEHLNLSWLETIHEECERAKRDILGEDRRRKLEFARADEEAQRLGDLYAMETLPAVRRELGLKWQAALERKKDLERSAATKNAPAAVFDDPALREELFALCPDFPRLFRHPKTTNDDRKEIASAVIERVTIEKKTEESIWLRARWRDAGEDAILEVKTFRAAYPLVDRYTTEGRTAAEIADLLNDEGIFNFKQQPWNPSAIARVRERLRKRRKR